MSDAVSSGRPIGCGSPQEDCALLRRYVDERNEAAFTALVERHLPLVYSAAVRRCNGNTHAAADVAQSVFIALARKAASLTHHAVLTGWLYATTRNIAVDLVRAEKRRQLHTENAHTMPDLLAPVETPTDWNALRPVLDGVMDQLSAADREAVLLRYFEQRSFAEIGAALRVSEDAARMRTERALEKLRALLARRGVTSTTAALATALGGQAVAAVSADFVMSIAAGALVEAGGFATAVPTATGLLAIAGTAKFITAVATVAAVTAAAYEVHAWHKTQSALVGARQEQQVRSAQWRKLEQHVQAAEASVAELKASLATTTTVAAAQAEAARKNAAWDPLVEGTSFLERHPEVKQAYTEWLDSMTNSMFADFWKSLDLSPEQIEQFRTLQRSRWGTFSRTITSDKRSGQLKLDNLIGLRDPANVAALRSILGEDGYRRYAERYLNPLPNDPTSAATRAARDTVRDVARGLCFSDTPLTTAQAKELVQSIAGNFPPSPAQRDWDVLDAQARRVLSEAQWPAWREISHAGRASRAAAIADAQASAKK